MFQERRLGGALLFPRLWNDTERLPWATDPLVGEARRLRGASSVVLPRLVRAVVAAAREAGAPVVVVSGGARAGPSLAGALRDRIPHLGRGSSCSWGPGSRVDWDLWSSVPEVEALCVPCRGFPSHAPVKREPRDSELLPPRAIARLCALLRLSLIHI